jgi:hypothetical protein
MKSVGAYCLRLYDTNQPVRESQCEGSGAEKGHMDKWFL